MIMNDLAGPPQTGRKPYMEWPAHTLIPTQTGCSSLVHWDLLIPMETDQQKVLESPPARHEELAINLKNLSGQPPDSHSRAGQGPLMREGIESIQQGVQSTSPEEEEEEEEEEGMGATNSPMLPYSSLGVQASSYALSPSSVHHHGDNTLQRTASVGYSNPPSLQPVAAPSPSSGNSPSSSGSTRTSQGERPIKKRKPYARGPRIIPRVTILHPMNEATMAAKYKKSQRVPNGTGLAGSSQQTVVVNQDSSEQAGPSSSNIVQG